MTFRIAVNPTGFSDYAALHRLLTVSYADMIGRIDPPSSITTMTIADIARKAREEDVFVAFDGATPIACLFGTARNGGYEVGKLAVAATYRRRGLARTLIDTASDRARTQGHPFVQLSVRVELTENHAAYHAMGFSIHATATHAGYTRPTSMIYRRGL